MLKVLTVLLLSLLATPALAQFSGPGSSRGGGQLTVAEVSQVRPGTQVILTGNFIQRYRDQYYRFRDATGEMLVEVDRRVWRNRPIGPYTKVQITGDVERSLFRGRHVDVERIIVLD